MPTKKANSKRGKTTVKAKIMPEPEHVLESCETKVTARNGLDATFLIAKDVVLSKEADDNAEEESVLNALGNGHAPETLLKIDEKDEEAMEKVNFKKTKGRPKVIAKKLEPQQSTSVNDNGNGDAKPSPKRSPDRSSEKEFTGAPPTKRNRGKKAPISKKTLKAEKELAVANDIGSEEMKSSPEGTSQESAIKHGQIALASEKCSEEEEEIVEPLEEKQIKKKGRPAKELSKNDEDIESVVAAPKTTKKRFAAKEKPILQPSTRPVRTRKAVVYEEKDNEEDEEVMSEKSKNVAPKKATAKKTDSKATKVVSTTKKRGRVAKEISREDGESGITE